MSIIKHRAQHQLHQTSSNQIFIHRDTLYNRFYLNRHNKLPQPHLNQTIYKRASTLQIFREQSQPQISPKKINFQFQVNIRQTTKSKHQLQKKFKTHQNSNIYAKNLKNYNVENLNINLKPNSTKLKIRNRIVTRSKINRNQSYCSPNVQHIYWSKKRQIQKRITVHSLQCNQRYEQLNINGNNLSDTNKRIHSLYLSQNKQNIFNQTKSINCNFQKLKTGKNRLCHTDHSIQKHIISQIERTRYKNSESQGFNTKKKEVLIIGNTDLFEKQKQCLNLLQVNLERSTKKQPIRLKFINQMENRVGPWSKKGLTQHQQFLCI